MLLPGMSERFRCRECGAVFDIHYEPHTLGWNHAERIKIPAGMVVMCPFCTAAITEKNRVQVGDSHDG